MIIRSANAVCQKHNKPYQPVACPDGISGCCVYHSACLDCRAERRKAREEQEVLEALQQANGVR